MRYGQAGFVDDALAMEQQVEIDQARCIAELARATTLVLDRQQRIEQRLRRKRRVERDPALKKSG